MRAEEGDFYFNEQGFMVFTREYHLKRGYCCKNDCKHCPWKSVDDKKRSGAKKN